MRLLSISNTYDIKHDTFPFDGVWKEVVGEPETTGSWLLWGRDKNGKTRTALLLAKYLSQFNKVLYVSAEEGTDKAFVDALKWAGLTRNDKSIHIAPYVSLSELSEKLRKRRSHKIIFLDNLTIYADGLKRGAIKQFLADHENKLIIFLAHEERKEPYTAPAKLAKKYAKIIMHVEGLACHVSGRCPGGILTIDEEKAALYHGQLTQ